MKHLIWTKAYSPFIMGGDVHAPIGAVVACMPVPLHKDFKGLLATNPNGTEIIAERSTGAIIGKSIKQVNKDIDACNDINIMKQQIEDAKKLVKRVRIVSPDEFWKRYNRE